MSSVIPVTPTGGAGVTAEDDAAIAAIRGLVIDAIERAGNGHPGLPLAMAPTAHLLYSRFLRHDPADPAWPDRDRFVLSAGHGSMLLYATLHVAGYGLSLDDLKSFRQWGSLTPGHPEYGVTPGVETTTGPLGAGFANGVGMAIAERFLRSHYGPEVVDHRIVAICGDGDMMEGVSSEAASLAGHLGLGRLVYIYDDNGITIDGPTSLAFSGENVVDRFRAYGWHVQSVEDANDLEALSAALTAAIDEEGAPSLIRVRSVIGYPSPGKSGTSAAHGAALGAEEARATKALLGLDPAAEFEVSDDAYAAYGDARQRGWREHAEWRSRFAEWSSANPALATEWKHAFYGIPNGDVGDVLPTFDPGSDDAVAKLSTRAAGARVMAAVEPLLPTMVGGSADLIESTKTVLPAGGSFSRTESGRNVHWGVREHAMGAAVNGLALHGGIVKPYGSTFLVFADYMRPAIRLSALMELEVVWVFTHDSIAVGEDGPTHQPVEHYASLRAIPGLTVIRPADANETAQAWRIALRHRGGPVALLLTRQDVPVLGAAAAVAGVERGGYVVRPSLGVEPEVTLVGTGSEVAVALDAAELLSSDGIDARVVSLPSWELFDAQPAEYRASVLPPGVPAVSVEAGVTLGWCRYADVNVGVDRFGASAPGGRVLQELGITAERVAAAATARILRGPLGG